MAYFGTIAGTEGSFPVWAFIPTVLLAIAGTMVAPYLLERMSDQEFRRWTRQIIFVVSVVYLMRAIWLYWQGATD
jgi:uncharacterized membrane protein YfcA